MREVVIVSAARTPIGSFGGSLKGIPTRKLGAIAIKAAVERAGIKPEMVEEVIMGAVLQGGLGQNVARQMTLDAGLPIEVPAMTINKVCGSGLRAVELAAQIIKAGDADIVVAGGAENMSATAYAMPAARWGARMNNAQMVDMMVNDGLWDAFNGYHMGITAENVAEQWGITREQLDEFSVISQNRAEAAIKAGKFKDEILPVELKDRKGNVTIFDTDEGPREGQSMEKLAKLRPCFVKGGTVTAANSSSLNDGAAAVVVMSKEKAEELGVTPKVKIEGYAIAGFDAELMGYSPKISSEKLADKLGLDLKSIDMFEINEAFASQAYAVSRDLGLDPEKVNIYGGGISIGHPIGATGAMLTVKVMYELMRTDKKDAMISMCIGGGQGISMYFTKCEA